MQFSAQDLTDGPLQEYMSCPFHPNLNRQQERDTLLTAADPGQAVQQVNTTNLQNSVISDFQVFMCLFSTETGVWTCSWHRNQTGSCVCVCVCLCADKDKERKTFNLWGEQSALYMERNKVVHFMHGGFKSWVLNLRLTLTFSPNPDQNHQTSITDGTSVRHKQTLNESRMSREYRWNCYLMFIQIFRSSNLHPSCLWSRLEFESGLRIILWYIKLF